MAQSRDEIDLSRIELVVLACLSQSKPPSDVEIGEVLQQLALPAESAEGARRRAGEIVAGLMRRAWVTADDPAPRSGKQRKALAPRKLTENGKRVLRHAFSLPRLPSWAQVRDKHLPSLALGVAPGSEIADKAGTETALIAAVLGKRLGVRDAFTPMAVCDAMIADALGMPRGKLTLDRMRAHVLARGMNGQPAGVPSPGVKGYAGKLAATIAYSVVGASDAGVTKHRMARALARQWVCGEADPLGAGSARHTATSAPPSRAVSPVHAVASSDASMRTTNAPSAPPARITDAPSEPVRVMSAQSEPSVRVAGAQSEPPARTTGAPSAQPARVAGAQSEPPVRVAGAESAPPVRTTATEVRGAQSSPTLLDAVRDAIPRIGSEGRFGEKVYVSAIWRSIERDRKAGGISLDNFKRWLVTANRDGKLVLARADLVGAMDAKQVTESEINDRGATFHFVLDQRNGASASQRESHAG